MSRPFVLAALGVLLIGATFVSLRSAAERALAEDVVAAPTVQPAPGGAPAKPPTPKPEAKPKPKPAIPGLPRKVAKAIDARRTVVLLFRGPAADDDATAGAVRSVRGMKGVSTFAAPITKLAQYRRITSGLGISQAPAVVIVGKSRKATLVEGFVDPVSLRQQVRDTR